MNQKIYSFIVFLFATLVFTFFTYQFSPALLLTFIALVPLTFLFKELIRRYLQSYVPEMEQYILPVYVLLTISVFHVSLLWLSELFEIYPLRSFIPQDFPRIIHLVLAGFFTAATCITDNIFPKQLNNQKP